MVLLLLIIIIHELGHLITATILKKEMSSVTIYPFGGLTKINSLLNDSILKEFIILIMGPITQILFFYLVLYLYKNGYVPENTFDNFNKINAVILVFNLLPILPLDGGRMLNLLLNLKFSYKYSHIVMIIISVLVITFLTILMLKSSVKFLFVLILLLLLKNIYYEIKMHKVMFNKFILERVLYNFNYKEGKIINTLNKLRRNKKHKILRKNKLYSERDYINRFYLKN